MHVRSLGGRVSLSLQFSILLGKPLMLGAMRLNLGSAIRRLLNQLGGVGIRGGGRRLLA